MSTFQLPNGWCQLRLSQDLTAYYNYESKVFSFGPVVDVHQFVLLASQHLAKQGLAKFDLSELNQKIAAHEQIIREKCGSLPIQQLPSTAQSEDLVLNVAVPQTKEVVNYTTQLQVSEIKGFNDKMDEITALVTVCRQAFQLAPSFDSIDRGPDFQARSRFETFCKFSQQTIATCAGPNKKVSKSIVAKLCLFKTAPNVYSAMFGDDSPPEDITDVVAQSLASGIPDEQLTLGDPQMMTLGCTAPIFKNYTPYKCLQIWEKIKEWKMDESERDNPLSSFREKDKVYVIEIHENKQLKFISKKEVPTSVAGRHQCAIEILAQIFGKNKKWLDLVQETAQTVNERRDKRGAPDKPILKAHKDYIQKQRDEINHQEFPEAMNLKIQTHKQPLVNQFDRQSMEVETNKSRPKAILIELD